MKKIQQFKIISLTYDRIRNGNFNLKLDINEAEANEEIIALADSEVLRAIRRITRHPFSEAEYMRLLHERRVLTRQDDTVELRQKIDKINKRIRDLLFIPEYVCVTTKNKRSYPRVGRDGFKINGRKYVRLLCGAAHARTNRAMFCAEDIYEELDKILRCGCENIKIVPAKWNAYYALSSTATFQMITPRVCVVADKEIVMKKLVDYVTEAEPQDTIERCEKELDFNLWDGMGLICPEFAQEWASELELDYLPSGFLVRAPFIKGMVATFDFRRFGREVANGRKIIDLWGAEHNPENIDIILTQSQFKLWEAYRDWADYEAKLQESGISWGVSHTTPNPKEEKHFARSNYQFVQVLNMNENDVAELCQPTIDWINNVARDDYAYMMIYLLGKMVRYGDGVKIWNNVQDNLIKALLLCPDLIQDEYVHSRIISSLNKRIRESYFGKLLLHGNFQTIFADPYGLCEHAFGLEVKGLLKEGEHYCKFWSDKGIDKVCGLRSPMTWKSEITELNFHPTEKQKDWYRYIDSGIIVNLWGLDYRLWSGADVDGDILFTTDNPVYLRCRYGGVPVVYTPQKAEKSFIDRKALYKVDMLGFGSNIGFITNCCTTLDEMQSLYPQGSKEYEEIDARLKICCKFQSHEIDHAKGIKTKPFPKHFTEFIKQDDINFEGKNIDFLNTLVVNKRPKFMRYLYSKYNKEYKAFLADFSRYSIIKWGGGDDELPKKIRDSLEYQEFLEYKNQKNPLLETHGVMNRVCEYMESNLKEIKRKNKHCDNELLATILCGECEIDIDKLAMIRDLKAEYDTFIKSNQLKDSQFLTYEQYWKHLRLFALANISSNIQELARLAAIICYKENPKKQKDFVWDLFGIGVVENLKERFNTIKVPILSEFGDIDYLHEQYELVDVDISGSIETEIQDIDLYSVDDILEDIEEIR